MVPNRKTKRELQHIDIYTARPPPENLQRAGMRKRRPETRMIDEQFDATWRSTMVDKKAEHEDSKSQDLRSTPSAQQGHEWFNELPVWIREHPEYMKLRQGPRQTLQVIANRCDAPLQGKRDAPTVSKALLGCFGGKSLTKTCGCSASTFWVHLKKLIDLGFVVPLTNGGGHTASAYGVPGHAHELDRFVARRTTRGDRGSGGDKAKKWTKNDTRKLRSLLSGNWTTTGEPVGVRKPDSCYPVSGVQPSGNETLPSYIPSHEPSTACSDDGVAVPADGAGAGSGHAETPTAGGTGDPAPEAADRTNDSRPEISTGAETLGTPDGSQTQTEVKPKNQTMPEVNTGIEKVLARAGVSSGSIPNHLRTALAHGYTERDLSDLWEDVATQANIKNTTGLFITRIKAGDRASGSKDLIFKCPDADLHRVLHGLGINSSGRDPLIEEFKPQWYALREQFGIDPEHAIQESLTMFGGSGDNPQNAIRILREHTTDVVSILAGARLGDQKHKPTAQSASNAPDTPPIITRVRLLLETLSTCTRQEQRSTIINDLTSALARAEETLAPEWSQQLKIELSAINNSFPVNDTPPLSPDQPDICLVADGPHDNSPAPCIEGPARVEEPALITNAL